MDDHEYAKMILNPFFKARRYYSDTIVDLRKIIELRTEMFPDWICDAPISLEMLSGYDKKPKAKYRMYIITSIRVVSLAYIDIPEEIVQKIIFDVKKEAEDFEDLKNLEPYFINTVYIFRNSKIIFSAHILPGVMAWILNSLKNENLIDYSLDNRWTDIFYDY